MIRQISSTLLSPTDRLLIQLSINLVDSSNDPSYSYIYPGTRGDYLTFNISPSICFKYIEKDRPWSKTDNIFVTQRNFFAVKEGLREFYNNVMDRADDIYMYGKSGFVAAMGNVEEHRRIIPLSPSQTIYLSPIAVYGSTGRPIPGVAMEINLEENLIEMSMDEFESIYDLFQTIQLHQEGMLLLQTYIITCLKGGKGGMKIPSAYNKKEYRKISDEEVAITMREKKDSSTTYQKEMVSGVGTIKQPTTLEELM